MKKRMNKQLLSLLLAAVLLLGSASGVLAASSAATKVTLDNTAATLYLRSGTEPRLTLNATITPSDYDGDITWSVTGDYDAVSLSSNRGNSIVVTGKQTGKATVTVTVYGTGGAQRTASCRVTVVSGDPAVTTRSDPANDISAQVMLGKNLSLKDIYDSLCQRFTNVG